MSARQDYALRALAETLRYELQLQGVPSTVLLGSFSTDRPQPVHILLDPFAYTGFEGEAALPDGAVARRTIFLCADPLPAALDDHQVQLLRRAGAVFATDQRSVVALRRAGIAGRLLKPGYSKSLDHFESESPRPIDVLFLGSQSRRRTETLSRLTEVLSDYRCRVEMPVAAPTAEETRSALAEGRWPLLAQSKILVNIHRDAESRLEWSHVLDALHAGAVVLTEHSSGIGPLIPGEHLFVASVDSLPYVAQALLADEQRLARVRCDAYGRLPSWLPYALWVSVLRAAIVELVGEPSSPDASLSRTAA